MYRLNYPNDPGMHNSDSQSKINGKRQTRHGNSQSTCEEIQNNWITFSFVVILLTIVSGIHIWNERRAIQVSRVLDESLRSIRKLPNIEVVFGENDNKLVHVVGHLVTDKELTAVDYGVSVHAVKLKQRLQMYQWQEDNTGEVDGDDISKPAISYSYYKTWVDHLVDSDTFHVKNIYENPKEMPDVESVEVAQTLKIGSFILCQGIVDKIDNFKPITGHIRPHSSAIKLHAGSYYHSEDVWKPQIGDIRVDFAVAGMAGEHADIISVIAKQEGNMLNPYVTQFGEEILIMKFGRKHPEDMIHFELSQNKMTIWLMRVISAFNLLFAVSRLTKMLNHMVHISPYLRDVLNLGTTHFSLNLTWSIYTFILGVLWFQHRPSLGLGFLFASVLPVVGIGIKIYLKDNSENMRNHAA